jgi:hypothetical protein
MSLPDYLKGSSKEGEDKKDVTAGSEPSEPEADEDSHESSSPGTPELPEGEKPKE